MEKFGFKEKVSRKKGFTLVELLVVLVIMAVLAAAIIPSMMGFIDKTRESVVLPNAKVACQAASVISNEVYGLGYKDPASGNANYGIFTDGRNDGAIRDYTALFRRIDGQIYTNLTSARKMMNLADISEDYACWAHFAKKNADTNVMVVDAVLYAQNDYVAYWNMSTSSWVISDDDEAYTAVTTTTPGGANKFSSIVDKYFK